MQLINVYLPLLLYDIGIIVLSIILSTNDNTRVYTIYLYVQYTLPTISVQHTVARIYNNFNLLFNNLGYLSAFFFTIFFLIKVGVFDEAKVGLTSLQCRIERIYNAGLALEKIPISKIAKSKFKIMFATIENVCNDFEIHMTTVIRHQYKGTLADEVLDIEKIRADFEGKYVSCKIIADEYLTKASTSFPLNKTFLDAKSTTSNVYYPVEKLAAPKFRGNPMDYTSF